MIKKWSMTNVANFYRNTKEFFCDDEHFWSDKLPSRHIPITKQTLPIGWEFGKWYVLLYNHYVFTFDPSNILDLASITGQSVLIKYAISVGADHKAVISTGNTMLIKRQYRLLFELIKYEGNIYLLLNLTINYGDNEFLMFLLDKIHKEYTESPPSGSAAATYVAAAKRDSSGWLETMIQEKCNFSIHFDLICKMYEDTFSKEIALWNNKKFTNYDKIKFMAQS